MSATPLDYPAIIAKFDALLAERGLGAGLGDRNGVMCVEAALCYAMDLPHSDDPQCVTPAVRAFKMSLNDKAWPSPWDRAAGLRDLGIAQLGSLGVVDDGHFARLISRETIRLVLPRMVQLMGAQATDAMRVAAGACVQKPSVANALRLRHVATVYAATYVTAAAAARLDILRLSASIALQTLIDLRSPGAAYLAPDAVARLRA